MSTLLNDVKTYVAANAPDTGTIMRDFMPASPDAVMVLYETGGLAPDLGFGVEGVDWENAGVQMVVRVAKNAHDTGRTRIEAAYRALAKVQADSLSGTLYYLIRPQQQPFLMSRDENERILFACNFLCWKEPS